jgi:hypothetical protein
MEVCAESRSARIYTKRKGGVSDTNPVWVGTKGGKQGKQWDGPRNVGDVCGLRIGSPNMAVRQLGAGEMMFGKIEGDQWPNSLKMR